MEFPMGRCLCMLMYILSTSFQSVSSFSTCPLHFQTFLHDLNSQCPGSYPIQVDGAMFERTMSSSRKNEYTAVLFYASWCPFSSIFRSKFSTLSSMYRHMQIKHVMVEQVSVVPSVFSRYGIHSVPSLLIVNQTKNIRYHGRKDLQSLVNFYRKTTVDGSYSGYGLKIHHMIQILTKKSFAGGTEHHWR